MACLCGLTRPTDPLNRSLMKCPICFSERVRIRSYNRGQPENRFLVCRSCGHGFCSLPVTAAQLATFNVKSFAELPGASGSQTESAAIEQASDRHARWLMRKAEAYARGTDLLDIGCYTGRLLRVFVHESRFRCHGNDIVPQACRYVRETLGIPVFEGAFSAERVSPARFDVILACHVLEHVDDPHAFVREIKAACNPGALVIVVSPHDAGLTARLKRRIFYPAGATHEYGHLHYPMHLQGYTKASLKALFVSEGCELLECTTLSKLQPAYGHAFRGWRERAFLPLHLLECLTDLGNLVCGCFRVPGTGASRVMASAEEQ